MHMSKKSKIKLSLFKIVGLFGNLNYTIPINNNQHVTAIIAPNGAGKTLCLRLISALFQKKWSIFNEIEFKEVEYLFSDSSKLKIEKNKITTNETEKETVKINFSLEIKNEVIEKWSPKRTRRFGFPIDRYIPFLTRVEENLWRHDHTGEFLDFDQIIDTYRNQIPDHLIENLIGKIPEKIEFLINSTHCRLIETQRLLVLKNNIHHRFATSHSTLAITEKAESLKKIISSELNKYAELSQSLDRSFPHRLITGNHPKNNEEISEQLASLDEKRKKLMDAGILDSEVFHSVVQPTGNVDEAIAKVLQVYIDDNKEKLSSLHPLLKKINLFKKLIDQRFITKDVRISKNKGIEVITSHGEVALDKLSSGEQHQLVLFFELLFEIKENSLILIDEPELSLHVSWQKKFIGDLLDIIELNQFDAILATHSPQLISHWDELVVELGNVYTDELKSETNLNIE